VIGALALSVALATVGFAFTLREPGSRQCAGAAHGLHPQVTETVRIQFAPGRVTCPDSGHP
jgi:hypothetical protein